MANQQDINLLIAGAVSQKIDAGYQIGLDDNHVFIRTGAQVFRVRVEEVREIGEHPDAERVAEEFMLSLPYGPGL